MFGLILLLGAVYGIGLLVTIKEDGTEHNWDYAWPVTLVKGWLEKLKQ